MDAARSHIDAGIAHFERGDFADAANMFRRALEIDPKLHTARLDLAACLVRSGQIAAAKEQFEQAAADGGTGIAPHLALGRIWRDEGSPADARRWFERAVHIDPQSIEALHELGTICLNMRDPAGAEAAFRRIRAIDANDAVALGNLCLALLALGRFDDVLRELTASESLVARDPSLLRVGAVAADRAGDPALALGYNRMILTHDPRESNALQGLLASPDAAERGRAREALLALLRNEGGDTAGWSALSHFAYNHDGYEAARDILDEGIRRSEDASLRMLRALLLPKVPLSHAQIADARAEMHKSLDLLISGAYKIDKPAKSVAKLPFHLAYHGRNEKELQQKIARAHLAASPQLAWTAPHVGRNRNRGERIRVGFISANLTRHSVGRMFGGFIEHLNPAHFEKIIVRPAGPVDRFGEDLNRFAERALMLPADLMEARKSIAALELDILFYADIGMDPFTYYLSFSRLAPVQMSWPGHPMTSGVATIDYFVTSSIAESPDCRDHYTEEPVLLSRMPTYFPKAEKDTSGVDRASLGLPEKDRLYICPMTIYKFHPDFDAIVAGILDRDRGGKLVLIAQDGYWDRAVIDRMAKAVPNLAKRLVVLPYLPTKRFLGLLKCADVILDTVHVCGANTSLDAFSYGIPIVTRLDKFARGRWTSAMYTQMGFTDLIAKDDGAYIDLAVGIANDSSFRRRASEAILERNSILFSDQGVVDELGERMRACYEERRALYL